MSDFAFVAITKQLLLSTGIKDQKVIDPLQLEQKKDFKIYIQKLKCMIKSNIFKSKRKVILNLPNSPEKSEINNYIESVFQYEMIELILGVKNTNYLLNYVKLINLLEQKVNTYCFHKDIESLIQAKFVVIKESFLAIAIKSKTLLSYQIPEIQRQINIHKKLIENLNESTIMYFTLKNTIEDLEYQKTKVFFDSFFKAGIETNRVVDLSNIKQLNKAIDKLSCKINESIRKNLPNDLISAQKEAINKMLKNYLLVNIYKKETCFKSMSNMFLTSISKSLDLINDINKDINFKLYIINVLDVFNIEIPACIEIKTQQEINYKISKKINLACEMAKKASIDAMRASIHSQNILNNLMSLQGYKRTLSSHSISTDFSSK